MKMKIVALLLVFLLSFCSCGVNGVPVSNDEQISSVSDIPEFDNIAYIAINDNEPEFDEDDLVTESYELYSELDNLGRCGVAIACIGIDIMPTEERGAIGQVKPSGWQTVKYDIVDGKYLYNRCHLIGYQLTGENANTKNLITGTRYLNIEGMLPFENMIADYVKETENHVLYRVTPIFKGDNLVASGVQMEAMSVEDKGEGISFNVYAYNNQPGIIIDYSDGSSSLEGEENTESYEDIPTQGYVLNTNTKKFHNFGCSLTEKIKENNKKEFFGEREELILDGYSSCKNCNP